MRLYADACVASSLVEALRTAGHDVVHAQEGPPGVDDLTILAAAAQDGRVLITEDQDFGALAVRDRRSSAGVVLVELQGLSAAAKAARVVALFARGEELAGCFTVLEAARTRSRPLGADDG